MEGRTGWLTEWAFLLLRVVVGFLFFCHGAQKVLGWFVEPGGQRMALAFPQLPWFAGWIEVVGGALIMIGLLTHLVAFLLSGEMAVAYFTKHFPLSSPFSITGSLRRCTVSFFSISRRKGQDRTRRTARFVGGAPRNGNGTPTGS